jgi:hypothetical protein
MPTFHALAVSILAIFLALPVRAQEIKEPWSAEQATGAPDTSTAEDAPTAWTPLEPNAGAEWLVVRFPRAVAIDEVRIRESLSPGTVSRVSATIEDGTEDGASSILWSGDDPTTTAPADFVVRAKGEVVSRQVRIELDTARRPGWKGIDAVELVGRDGSRQWAMEAEASSSYATVGGVLAGELAPAARLFADEAVGIRMSAPGFWIRANPALLEVPGAILRAWTRDGRATVVVFRRERLERRETDRAWSAQELMDRVAAELESGLGAEVKARELHRLSGLDVVGVVARGSGEDGMQLEQHWVLVPRQRDLIVLLLSAPAVSFDADERTFEKMLASVEIREAAPPIH